MRKRIGQVGGLVTLQVGDLSSFVAAASKRGIKVLARRTGGSSPALRRSSIQMEGVTIAQM